MKTRATSWLDVSGVGFDDAETRAVKGGFVRVLPSPFDLPVSLRTLINDSNHCQLELRYLNSEPLAHGTFKDGAEITYGRKSYRPYVISVTGNPEKNQSAYQTKINSALDSFLRVYAIGSALSPVASVRFRSSIGFIKTMLRKNLKELTTFSDEPS